MAEWTPALFLDPRSNDPVYLQIAHALMKEIHRGRFRPGDLLPGYRTLAEQVGVSRNTVMSAYHELQTEGWVVSAPGEGSTVASRIPRISPPVCSRGARCRERAGTGLAFRSGPSRHRPRRALDGGSWRWRVECPMRASFRARRSRGRIAGRCCGAAAVRRAVTPRGISSCARRCHEC